MCQDDCGHRDLLLEAASALRASTHPEQSGRVEAMEKVLRWYADPDHWLDGQAGEWIVEEGNHVSGDGFAHNEFDHDNGERARVALEPASPTPTEQGEADGFNPAAYGPPQTPEQPRGEEARAECPFCDYDGPSEVLYRGRFDYIIEPLNPVTPGHLLVIPHAHVTDFADTGTVSAEAIRTAAWWVSTQDRDGDYNLITSKGEAASQTVGHLHFHLIPRRKGDGLALPWGEPAPPSEQPREGTARVECALCHGTHFYKQPMAAVHGQSVNTICPYCGPPTNDTAQPEQPRGEEARCPICRKPVTPEAGRFVCDDCADPAPPRGEGDDLAARLEEHARKAIGKAADCTGSTRHLLNESARIAREAASALRASTEGESARVELTDYEHAIRVALRYGSEADHRRLLEGMLADLDPAPPSSEQESARVG